MGQTVEHLAPEFGPLGIEWLARVNEDTVAALRRGSLSASLACCEEL